MVKKTTKKEETPKKAEKPKEKKAVKKVEKKEEPKKVEPPKPVEKKPKPKKKRRKPAKKPAKKVFVARGKRKESVARATIKEGKGVIRVNSRNITSYTNPYMREIVREPLRYMGPEVNNVDISVNVSGGGVMGQAQAARTAIANALTMYFDDMNLKQKFVELDRSLVIDDTRRVETKKYCGPKARARFQKSYR